LAACGEIAPFAATDGGASDDARAPIEDAPSPSVDGASTARDAATRDGAQRDVATNDAATEDATDAMSIDAFRAAADVRGDVNGIVIDRGGVPTQGASVSIVAPGFAASTTTDANGRFFVADVPGMFDLSVLTALDASRMLGQNASTSFFGATSRSLFVTVPTAFGVRKSHVTTAPLTGQGISFPLASHEHVQAPFLSQVGLGADIGGLSNVVPDPNGVFSEDATWLGGSPATGVYYLLYFQNDASDSAPATFKGFARFAGAPVDGVAGTVPASPLGPLGTAIVSGHVTFPPDAIARAVSVGAKLDAVDRVGHTYFGRPFGGDADFSFSTPRTATSTALVFGLADVPNPTGGRAIQILSWKTHLPIDASGVQLGFPATAAAIIAPVDDAAITATDTFSWQGGKPPYQVSLTCSGPSGYSAQAWTMATSWTPPSDASLSWPSGQSCSFILSSYGAPSSVDDVLALDGDFDAVTMWGADGFSTLASVTVTAQ
jgi:hypothetical protein